MMNKTTEIVDGMNNDFTKKLISNIFFFFFFFFNLILFILKFNTNIISKLLYRTMPKNVILELISLKVGIFQQSYISHFLPRTFQ